MYKFPKDFYADVRIEENAHSNIYIRNGEIEHNSAVSTVGAIVRVYDGEMWYSSVTNDIGEIQHELDNLAGLAKPNPDILNDPMVKNFEVNKAEVLIYDGENDIRKISREKKMQLLDDLIADCVDDSIPEIGSWNAWYYDTHTVKRFYSSKGAAITQDSQTCFAGMFFDITVNGVTTSGGDVSCSMTFDIFENLSERIIAERDRTLDFAKNAVDIEPGEYTCVLAPVVTAMFTHESFGHKSEADFIMTKLCVTSGLWAKLSAMKRFQSVTAEVCRTTDIHLLTTREVNLTKRGSSKTACLREDFTTLIRRRHSAKKSLATAVRRAMNLCLWCV
jgi:TldD protein